jgi:hypothetical protein
MFISFFSMSPFSSLTEYPIFSEVEGNISMLSLKFA